MIFLPPFLSSIVLFYGAILAINLIFYKAKLATN